MPSMIEGEHEGGGGVSRPFRVLVISANNNMQIVGCFERSRIPDSFPLFSQVEKRKFIYEKPYLFQIGDCTKLLFLEWRSFLNGERNTPPGIKRVWLEDGNAGYQYVSEYH